MSNNTTSGDTTMSSDNTIDLDAFEGHTPGEWGWFTYGGKSPHLATQRGGRVFILVPERQGMQGATVRLQGLPGPEKGLLVEFSQDHPDVKLIAAAPALLALAKKQRDELVKWRELGHTIYHNVDHCEHHWSDDLAALLPATEETA